MQINLKKYYSRSHDWSEDIYSHAIIWRNWALLFVLLSLSIAIISLIILFKIFPLKENTPFLVFIDGQKGEPLMIKPVASQDLINNEYLKRYMIRKFIIARERYNPLTLSDDEEIIIALSDELVYRDYRYYVAKNNPMSPVNVYKNSTIDVGNINISFLNEHRAYVSFILLENNEGIIKEFPASAQIKFGFSEREIHADDAYMINPVNFEVLNYQSHYQVNNEVYL